MSWLPALISPESLHPINNLAGVKVLPGHMAERKTLPEP